MFENQARCQIFQQNMNLIRIEASMIQKLKVKVLLTSKLMDQLMDQTLATQKFHFLHATVLFQGEEASRDRSCKALISQSYLERKVFFTLRGTYLLLTKYEGRTVSYGPSFFPHRFMIQA